VPLTLNSKYAVEIQAAAKAYELDPYLVAAIVATESSFDPRALRYEAHYKWYYGEKEFSKEWGVSVSTAKALQRFSYGLMQIMGAVALEHGFKAHLHDLCKPDVGLYWGCKYFAVLLKKHGDRNKAISSYNQGSPRKNADGSYKNQEYVDKVLARHKEFIDANRVS